MKKSLKHSASLVAAGIVAVIGAALVTGDDDPAPRETTCERDEHLVLPDRLRLTNGTDAVSVEFPKEGTGTTAAKRGRLALVHPTEVPTGQVRFADASRP